MRRRTVPSIQRPDLRDCADEERVERVWGRLRRDLSAVELAPASRSRAIAALLVAAISVAFAGGVLAGKVIWGGPAPEGPAAVASNDALPAGTAEGALEPLVPLPSSTANRRGGREPPASRPRSAAARPGLAPPHAATEPAPAPGGSVAPPGAAVDPGWRALHREGDLGGALAVLQRRPGGIDAAIASAETASELMDLSDVLRSRGGDRAAGIRALARVVDAFPKDANAPLAAFTLGRMFEQKGEPDLATIYYERAARLAPDGSLQRILAGEEDGGAPE